MPARQFSQSVYRGLKTATKGLVDACGGLKVAEYNSRVKGSSIATYYSQSEQHEKAFAPLDVWIDLMCVTEDLRSLDYVASLFGKVLVDAVEGEASGQSFEKTIEAITTGSETIAVFADAAKDKDITPKEAEKMLRFISTNQKALADLQETCTAILTK